MLASIARRVLFSALLASFLFGVFTAPAWATLKFYYDPNTGNVSFDTAETRTGVLYGYTLGLNVYRTDIRFFEENLISLTDSTFLDQRDHLIGETTFSQPLSGLYTIGDVLPAGLSEETWNDLFGIRSNGAFYDSVRGTYVEHKGQHAYIDMFGGREYPDPAELLYGAPEGEFENRLDLLDPNTIQWAQSATLVYNPLSGEVVFNTTGLQSGYTTAFFLESEGVFLSENFAPFIDTPIIGATPDTLIMFADIIDPGQYSLGEVLPSGMSLGEFQGVFTNARFLERAGFKGGSLDFETDGVSMSFALAAVPEPASMTLLLGAIVGLLSRRRQSPQ